MIRLNDITREILSHHPNADITLVEKAYVYSAKVHQGQIRLSGEPYLSHPLEVAHILAQMKMDVVCIAAGLLHDTIEDTEATLEEIESLFGSDTAKIVDGVTKISKIQFSNREQRQAENIRKMILAMSSDIRVILVKLADRLHNMSTLGYHKPERQRQIAQETLDIYAPLAGRMGIYWMKSRLEDLCLYYLEPAIYNRIKEEIARKRGEREKFIKEVRETIASKLSEHGIQAHVKGRHKHFYSIYQKMREQNLAPSQVYDVVAFRVIVTTIKECYEALGHIHAMWKPVPQRFKDYISLPKTNMYQSLHTTVVGPIGEIMEIQIRTWEMDAVAEQGIAAHWKYKEGVRAKESDEKQFAWLRQLLEYQQSLKDPVEFLESVRVDLFPNEVYVFTPKGEVKEFPKGATPIDFAYSIHSEVGHHCMGAKVNGRMVSLKYQLETGDIVEIITSPKAHPSKDWLELAKTPRARTKIRQWINRQERQESITLGKAILEREVAEAKLNLPNPSKNETLKEVAKELSYQGVDDLLAQIGFGKVSPKQVIGRLKSRLGLREERTPGFVSKLVHKLKRRKDGHGIQVRGVGDMLIRFANCCHPLPGEEVVGYITRGRGITVHHKGCKQILSADPDRIVEISWNASDEEVYLAKLRITSLDKKGILAEISSIIAKKDANIIQAEIKTTSDKKGIASFTVEVKDYSHLRQIIDELKRLKNILMVERI